MTIPMLISLLRQEQISVHNVLQVVDLTWFFRCLNLIKLISQADLFCMLQCPKKDISSWFALMLESRLWVKVAG